MNDMFLARCCVGVGSWGGGKRRVLWVDKARRGGRADRRAGADPSRARRAGPVTNWARLGPAVGFMLQQASHSAATGVRAGIGLVASLGFGRRVSLQGAASGQRLLRAARALHRRSAGVEVRPR